MKTTFLSDMHEIDAYEKSIKIFQEKFPTYKVEKVDNLRKHTINEWHKNDPSLNVLIEK